MRQPLLQVAAQVKIFIERKRGVQRRAKACSLLQSLQRCVAGRVQLQHLRLPVRPADQAVARLLQLLRKAAAPSPCC